MKRSVQAFEEYSSLPAGVKAKFLRDIAAAIEKLGDSLIKTVNEETNLPEGRLAGERARTCNQLRMFADILDEGSWVEAVIDTALPDREPIPRPDLRRMLVPYGPVVVFGASNFPLAFSTAGGDTASALASGSPVILKGHPAHPRTSGMVAEAIYGVIKDMGFPEGVFQHVEGGADTGQELISHPSVKAVAFTGSFQGGMAIFKTAMARPEPIPVFLEMGSVNPMFVLPGKIKEEAREQAVLIAKSVLLGAGQFCTSPGLVFVPDSDNTETFLEAMAKTFNEAGEEKMLHKGIVSGYYDALESTLKVKGVDQIVRKTGSEYTGAPTIGVTSLENWLDRPELQNEVFGPFTLVVRYKDQNDLLKAAKALRGQLTCSLIGNDSDLKESRELATLLSEKSGRLIFNGVPTGVEVSYAMTHGGPFPATTDSRNTSVGAWAIKRFVRPVTFQSAPAALLPEALKSSNPLGIMRVVNGKHTDKEI